MLGQSKETEDENEQQKIITVISFLMKQENAKKKMLKKNIHRLLLHYLKSITNPLIMKAILLNLTELISTEGNLNSISLFFFFQ